MNIINQAVKKLKNGDIVALPTETVYGLAVDILNLESIIKLYNLKGRPSSKPIAIAISEPNDVKECATFISDDASKLINAFWPGPLTIVLPCSTKIPKEIISSAHSSIGVRCPSGFLIHRIIQELGRPICLTSANLAGEKEALTANQVLQFFPNEVFIVEDDQSITGKTSTIVDVSVEPYQLLREGAITFSQIQRVLGQTK